MIKKIFSLFAAILFAGSMIADDYVKVTSAPTDWSGDYLIVYEDGSLAFNGGLTPKLDVASNTIDVTIADGKIASNTTTDAAKFTIASVSGGYSIQAANGNYIGATSYSNSLVEQSTAIAHSLSLDASGNAVIGVTISGNKGGTVTMRYNTASNQARFRYYKSGQQAVQLYKLESGSTPVKTLTGVAVSGTPTKTSYYAGDDFDPAGLTVTGTYSDKSTAPITSGITWAYNPSQTLALNQTSIGVTATVSEITSAEYNVTGLTVTEAPVPDDYELVVDASNLADGDEIIIVNEDEDYAMGSQNSSNRAAVAVSATNHIITPGENVQIIVLEASSTNWKLKVGEDSYLYASSNSSNQLKTTTSSSAGDNGVWAITIANDGTATAIAQGSNGRNDMRYNPNNGSPLFSCYASSSTMAKVKIYKKAGEPSADPSISASNIALGTEWIKSTETFKKEVELIVAGANLTEGITVESSNPTEVAVSTTSLSAEGGTVTVTIETGIGELNETITLTSGSTSKVVAVTGIIKEIIQYEVAEAILNADQEDIKKDDVIEVRGFVTSIQIKGSTFETYHNAMIYVKDATEEEKEFEYFNCFSYGGANFTATYPAYSTEENSVTEFESVTDVNGLTFSIGDEVIARGKYTKYNDTYELATGCFLVYAKSPGANWPTSVDNTDAANKAVKFIENGQLFIELNGHIYNVQGQTVK